MTVKWGSGVGDEYFLGLVNTGSTRDDPYWTSRKNSLDLNLIELSSINKVSLV